MIYFGDPPVDLTRRATHEINALGVARTFQTLRLFANMTVVENVLVGMNARLHAGLVKAVIQTRARGAKRQRRKPRRWSCYLCLGTASSACTTSLRPRCPMPIGGASK